MQSTERKLPDLAPVRHKKEGYDGWIDGVTRSKDLFTGNKNCEWQYRIRLADVDKRRIAPEEDLEVAVDSRQFPPWFNKDESSVSFGMKDETHLHKLGYKLGDLSLEERQSVLINVAMPILGLREVAGTILAIIENRLKMSFQNIEKNRHSMFEWNKDLSMLLERFGTLPEISDLKDRIISMKARLEELKIK